MPDKETEKIIGGAVDIALADQFDSQVFGRRFKKKTLFKAFARWWIGLSEDEQKRFYGQADAQLTETFSQWVERIIDERIKAHVPVPKPDSESPPRSNMVAAIDDVVYYVRYKLPSKEEQKALAALRRSLGPDVEIKKAKKRSAS